MKNNLLKVIVLLLSIMIVFSFASCGIDGSQSENNEFKVDKDLFTDKVLIKALRKDGINDLTKTGVLDVKSITIAHSERKMDFNELKAFKNLEKLTIINCNIEDYSFINDFSKLKKLVLRKNSIKGKMVLNLHKLEHLEISKNNITALSGNLPRLKSLDLTRTSINNKSLKSMKGGKNLQEICISRTKVNNLYCLLRFKKLESIDLTQTKIKNFECLQKFTHLNTIYLDEEIDRSVISFLEGNFKDGDIYTKAYIVSQNNNLLLRN